MTNMISVPGLKKYAACGICGIFTQMSVVDDCLGFVCGDCNEHVLLAEWGLTIKGIRPPKQGDILPTDELL